MRPTEYRVGFASRGRHLYEIEARFPLDGAPVEALDLELPLWTPGSYLVREYERHLQDLACTDENDRPLAVTKTRKATWRVTLAGAREVRARYRVYAHEVTVRTAHLDHSHGFWNGACLFLYTAAARDAPARVIVDAPAGWLVATALEREGGDRDVFRAPDYDALVDSPFEVGPHERLEFTVLGKRHVIAVWGRADLDRPRLIADVTRIIEAEARLFGGLPYEHYTFLLHLVPGAYGGLEHRDSSTLLASPFAFSDPHRYQDFLELVSHEFFHLWNVKRLYPEALGRFDYQGECYTRSLWVVEGWTSYYDRLVLRRAGLQPAARYLEKLGEELTRLHDIAGRTHQSLEEASFDAWIKHYRPDENTRNTTVSYYLKGSIVALLLDLEIRRRTEGRRSLDDALAALFSEYGHAAIDYRRRPGYPDDAVERVVTAAAGVPLGDFFARAVRSTEELDLDGPLGSVGLKVARVLPHEGEEKPGGWLGATLVQEGARLKLTEVHEDGPAQAGGLAPGDEILALDGWRVDDAQLKERLAARHPGDEVRFTIFRRDELREVRVPLGQRAWDKLEVVPVEDAAPAARAAYQAWLGEPWSPPKKK